VLTRQLLRHLRTACSRDVAQQGQSTGGFRSEGSLKITAFWNMSPCSLVEVNRRFRDAYCLLHRPNDGCSLLQATRRYIPENCRVYTHHRENLISHKKDFLWHIDCLIHFVVADSCTLVIHDCQLHKQFVPILCNWKKRKMIFGTSILPTM
jgi:hypothetical protein